jgi:hypothetical protein
VNLVHLARRFFGSLRRGAPVDEQWAIDHLAPAERALWSRMSDPDRRHAVEVARRVPEHLRVAALLHDVGKVESGLGTIARVGVTVLGLTGRDRWGGRIGAYLHHDAIGATLLRDAGSDALTVAWAREHHLRRERWTVPRSDGDALKDADDD